MTNKNNVAFDPGYNNLYIDEGNTEGKYSVEELTDKIAEVNNRMKKVLEMWDKIT